MLTRRVLLTAGGLTVLAGSAAALAGGSGTPVQNLTAAAETRAVRTRPASRQLIGGSTVPGRAGQPSRAPVPAGGASGRRATGSRTGTPRRRRAAAEPMYYVHDGPKAIALTIDDGPSPVYTPRILRLLARYKVTATFSMIGIQVAAEPAIARDVLAAGHVISNHTWRHLDLAALAPGAVADEVYRATDAIHKATGHTPALFRAPYGAWSPAVLRCCQQVGMTSVDWSVDPRDWARPGVSAIVSNIMHNTGTGSIILEHDGGGNRAETVTALSIVLPRLLDAGYRFVTPSALPPVRVQSRPPGGSRLREEISTP